MELKRTVVESVDISNTNMTETTVVDVIVVFTDAQYCQSSIRMNGQLLDVLNEVYTSLSDRDEEEDDEFDFNTLDGVRAALSNYSERAGDEDDVWTIINLADMTQIS